MRFFGVALGLTGLSLFTAGPAGARPFRIDDIPNGQKFTCLNCHIDYKPSAQTDFGSDAQGELIGSGTPSAKHVDWAPICPVDSDHDGWTNGQELGDPDCTWTMGDPNPKGSVFNPGVPESHPPAICGNGKLDAGEACEGTMLAETDCAQLGAGEGSLACTDSCAFDYSACSAPPDGVPVPEGEDPSTADGCSAAPGSVDTNSSIPAALLLGLVMARGLARRRSQRS